MGKSPRNRTLSTIYVFPIAIFCNVPKAKAFTFSGLGENKLQQMILIGTSPTLYTNWRFFPVVSQLEFPLKFGRIVPKLGQRNE